jgi:vesicle transport through interaction with t-SNAREs protein 1
LAEAKKCATAMQGLAEVEGDVMRTREAQQRLERDIGPLAKEVQRALTETGGREELFYQAPDIEQGSSMDSLLQSSDDLLRESQSILAETEHIGTTTLQQMGRQREQINNANTSLAAVQAVAVQAKNILVSMSRRAFKSKLALYAMIAALAMANFYVLYRIFKKHHKS